MTYDEYGESNSYQGGECCQHKRGYEKPRIDQVCNGVDEGDREDCSNALRNVLGRHAENDDNDEDEDAPHRQHVSRDEIQNAASAHDRIYGEQQGQPQDASSRDIGSAAAMKAFQMFSQGGSGGSSDLVGMAMKEGMALMSQQGGGVDKTEMLGTAASMAMKLLATQNSSSSGGLGDAVGLLSKFGGGGGGTMSLLSKFL